MTSPIILGLWPVAGVTTVGVTRDDARDTVRAAIDAGVTQFDTAFSYGYDGESDRLIGTFLGRDRDRFTLIGKVGQRWSADRQRVVDGSPDTLREDAETSLRRIGVDAFDLLMLHSPDPLFPVERSAEAFVSFRRRGLCRRVGICNATPQQRRVFAEVAGCDAIQSPLNLMQPGPLNDVIPEAAGAGCDVHVYWTLMKGLLAGRISRDHVFADGDSRPGYAVYQGEPRRRAHEIVDRLGQLGGRCGVSVAQLAIGWALSQPGVTAALVGARRPEQIRETAAARPLTRDVATEVDGILTSLADRPAGTPESPDGS